MSFRNHLVRWEDEFRSCGLVVVEISGGKFASFDESCDRLAKWDVRHAVLWDKENKNIGNYGINSWPSAYLIGSDGKVFWQGNPAALRGRQDDEDMVRKLLKEELDKAKRPRR